MSSIRFDIRRRGYARVLLGVLLCSVVVCLHSTACLAQSEGSLSSADAGLIGSIEERFSDVFEISTEDGPRVFDEADAHRVAELTLLLEDYLSLPEVRARYSLYRKAFWILFAASAYERLEVEEMKAIQHSIIQAREMGILRKAWAEMEKLRGLVGEHEKRIRRFESDEDLRESILEILIEGRATTMEEAMGLAGPDEKTGLRILPLRFRDEEEAATAVAEEIFRAAFAWARLSTTSLNPARSNQAAALLENTLLAEPLRRRIGRFTPKERLKHIERVDESVIRAGIPSEFSDHVADIVEAAKARELAKAAFREIDWRSPEVLEEADSGPDWRIQPDTLAAATDLYNDILGVKGGVLNLSDETFSSIQNRTLTLALTLIWPSAAASLTEAVGVSALRAYLSRHAVAWSLRSWQVGAGLLAVNTAAGFVFSNFLIGVNSLWYGPAAWDSYWRDVAVGMTAWLGFKGMHGLVNAFTRNTLLARHAVVPAVNRWLGRATLTEGAEAVAASVQFLGGGIPMAGLMYLNAATDPTVARPRSFSHAYAEGLLYCLLMRLGQPIGRAALAGALQSGAAAARMFHHTGSVRYAPVPVPATLRPKTPPSEAVVTLSARPPSPQDHRRLPSGERPGAHFSQALPPLEFRPALDALWGGRGASKIARESFVDETRSKLERRAERRGLNPQRALLVLEVLRQRDDLLVNDLPLDVFLAREVRGRRTSAHDVSESLIDLCLELLRTGRNPQEGSKSLTYVRPSNRITGATPPPGLSRTLSERGLRLDSAVSPLPASRDAVHPALWRALDGEGEASLVVVGASAFDDAVRAMGGHRDIDRSRGPPEGGSTGHGLQYAVVPFAGEIAGPRNGNRPFERKYREVLGVDPIVYGGFEAFHDFALPALRAVIRHQPISTLHRRLASARSPYDSPNADIRQIALRATVGDLFARLKHLPPERIGALWNAFADQSGEGATGSLENLARLAGSFHLPDILSVVSSSGRERGFFALLQSGRQGSATWLTRSGFLRWYLGDPPVNRAEQTSLFGPASKSAVPPPLPRWYPSFPDHPSFASGIPTGKPLGWSSSGDRVFYNAREPGAAFIVFTERPRLDVDAFMGDLRAAVGHRFEILLPRVNESLSDKNAGLLRIESPFTGSAEASIDAAGNVEVFFPEITERRLMRALERLTSPAEREHQKRLLRLFGGPEGKIHFRWDGSSGRVRLLPFARSTSAGRSNTAPE